MNKTIEDYASKWLEDLENMSHDEDPGCEELQLTQFERSLLRDLKKLFPNLVSKRKRISGTRLISRALAKDEAKLRRASRFSRLDDFTAAYIEAALWSSHDTIVDEDSNEKEISLDEYFTYKAIDPECLSQMIEDCRRFQEKNYDDIFEIEPVGQRYSNAEMAGQDFWLTRNGYGAGFWDGDWPEPQAARLTKAAEAFGEVDLYIGGNMTTIHCG